MLILIPVSHNGVGDIFIVMIITAVIIAIKVETLATPLVRYLKLSH